jgi:Tn3 transposase DDE domain
MPRVRLCRAEAARRGFPLLGRGWRARGCWHNYRLARNTSKLSGAWTRTTKATCARGYRSGSEAIPDSASLIQLRKLVQVMLPRIGLPEVIVEVMSWLPGFVGAFTSVSGGRTRLEDLHVSIAACLAAHAMNIDLAEVVKRGVPALERGRLSRVNQNCLGAETYVVANPYLVEHQAGIPYAQALGGGLVAGIAGMRFVVPIPSIYARPNRKYFGPDRGVTYLNMITDQLSAWPGRSSQARPVTRCTRSMSRSASITANGRTS